MKHCFKSSLCHACGEEPQHPAMCLVCGFLVCGATKCGDGAAGGCTQHAEICGKGVSPFLFLKEWALFFCMKNNRRCFYPTLYLDEHGEEDPSLKRGILLHLQEERWENLRQMYVHGNFEHMTQVLYRTSRGRRSLTYWDSKFLRVCTSTCTKRMRDEKEVLKGVSFVVNNLK